MMLRSIKDSIEWSNFQRKEDTKKQQQRIQRMEYKSRQLLEECVVLDDSYVSINEKEHEIDLNGKYTSSYHCYKKKLNPSVMQSNKTCTFISENHSKNCPISIDVPMLGKTSQDHEYDEEVMQKHLISRIPCVDHQNYETNDNHGNFLCDDDASNSEVADAENGDSYDDADLGSTCSSNVDKEHHEENRNKNKSADNHFNESKEGNVNKVTNSDENPAQSPEGNKKTFEFFAAFEENENLTTNSYSNVNPKKISKNKSKKADIELNKAILKYAIAAGYISNIDVNYDNCYDVRQAVELMLDSYKPTLETSSNLTAASLMPPKRPWSSYNVYFHLERQRLLVEQKLQLQQQIQQQGKDPSNMENINRVPAEVLISRRSPHVDYTVYDIIDLNRSKFDDLGSAIPLLDSSEHPQNTAGYTCSNTNTSLMTTNKTEISRKHRKTHGMISFTQLARAVAWRWKNEMSRAQHCVFHGYFTVELDRFKKRYAVWMKEQQSLHIKIQQQQRIFKSSTKFNSGTLSVLQIPKHGGDTVIARSDAEGDANSDAYTNDDGHSFCQTSRYVCWDSPRKRKNLMTPMNNRTGRNETTFGTVAVATPSPASVHMNSRIRAVQKPQTDNDQNVTNISNTRESTKGCTTSSSISQNPKKLPNVPYNLIPMQISSSITDGCQEVERLQDGERFPFLSMTKTMQTVNDHTSNHCYNDVIENSNTIPDVLNEREMNMMRLMMKMMNDKGHNLDISKYGSKVDLLNQWQLCQQLQKQQSGSQKKYCQQLWEAPHWINGSNSSKSYCQREQPQLGLSSSDTIMATEENQLLVQLQQEKQFQLKSHSDQRLDDDSQLSPSLFKNNIRNLKCHRVSQEVSKLDHDNYYATEIVNTHNSTMDQSRIPCYFDMQPQQQQQKEQQQHLWQQHQQQTIFNTKYQQHLFQLTQQQQQQHGTQQNDQQQQHQQQNLQEKMYRLSNHGTDDETSDGNVTVTTKAINQLKAPFIEEPFSLSSSTHFAHSYDDAANTKNRICINNYQFLPQKQQCGNLQQQQDYPKKEGVRFDNHSTPVILLEDENKIKTTSDQQSQLHNLSLFQHEETDYPSFRLGRHSCRISLTDPYCKSTKKKSETFHSTTLATHDDMGFTDEFFHNASLSLLSQNPKLQVENNTGANRYVQKSNTYKEKRRRPNYGDLVTNDIDVGHLDSLVPSIGTKLATQNKKSGKAVTKIRRTKSAPTKSKTKKLSNHKRTTTCLNKFETQHLVHLKFMMKEQQKKINEQKQQMERLMKMTQNLENDFVPIDNDDCTVGNNSFKCDASCVNKNDTSILSLLAPSHGERQFENGNPEYGNDRLWSVLMMNMNETQENGNFACDNQHQSDPSSDFDIIPDYTLLGNNKFQGDRHVCNFSMVDETEVDSLKSCNR